MHSPDHRPDHSHDATPLAGLGHGSAAVAGIALVLLVAVQAWQVLARYALNSSPGWTEPVSLLMLSTAMSLGAAAGVQRGAHFAFHLLRDALPAAASRAARMLGHAIVAAIGAVLAAYGSVLFVDGWPVRLAGAPLPQGSVFAPLAVGGALMLLFAMTHLVSEWRGRRPG